MKRLQDSLRAHAAERHARSCPSHHSRCECGRDIESEKLLRQAANRIEDLEADRRWRPEEQEK